MSSILTYLWVAACFASHCAHCSIARSSDPNLQIFGEPQLDPSAFVDVPMGNVDTMENDIPGDPIGAHDFEIAVHMSHPSLDTKHQADPIELAGLYQGDIILNMNDSISNDGMGGPANIRNAVVEMSKLWPKGIIPYVVSSSYNNFERATIAMALKEYQGQTCLKFVPRTVERDYIHILKGDGCSSSVGRQGGAQKVSLGPGCLYVGIVMHELMHAAGFWHEQSRGDRDNYITINRPNIQDGMWYNFEKSSWDKIQTLGVEYDLGSIMHYGPYAFAKDRTRPTIIPRVTGAEIGQRRGFSKKDIQKLQLLYNCSNTTAEENTLNETLTTIVPEVCKDSNKFCKTWAGTGECENNPVWMGANCKKACNLCETVATACEDKHRYCKSWAKSGECQANPAYMRRYCKKSCKKC
ncbi:zinc metalloproteinase nas-4-like isoform X2 [Macrobrachium nipponense]|uniref:zinc metalloproteinase nas-4-like isoform X2 n=1 Tax=Macrobrachium nipponense TaxID=159736 RepID=UPI0030C8CB30